MHCRLTSIAIIGPIYIEICRWTGAVSLLRIGYAVLLLSEVRSVKSKLKLVSVIHLLLPILNILADTIVRNFTGSLPRRHFYLNIIMIRSYT